MALKEARGAPVKVGKVKEEKVAHVKGGKVSQVREGRVAQVKEGKVGQVKKAAGGVVQSSGNGEALLEVLKGEDVTGLSMQLKIFVAPLNVADGGVKEDMSRTELHKLAKQFVPFLVRLLKLCFANVANLPAGEQEKVESRGDELFTAVEIALDSLDLLRSFITGSPFEIEIQRCSFVRRLLAWRRHSAALVQCRKNFSSLCLKLAASIGKDSCKQGLAGAVKGQKCAVTMVAEKKRIVHSSVLPCPQDVELTLGLPTLVCGIVTDLIWCTGESAPTSSESYHEILSLPPQLEPWLMALDSGAVGKQKDTLYKGLYKCVSVLVANPAHYGGQLVREFSMLTLRNCAASPLCKQYFKVACKLSHCLSYHGGSNIRVGLDVSEAAMKASYKITELQSLWADSDALELVDGYVRLCQTSKRSVEGCAYLCDLVYHVRQISPSVAAILGLYAIGLKFCSDVVDLDTECNDFLRDGAALMESCVQQESKEDTRKYTFGVLKAFEMVKKNSSKYIQGVWGSFVTERKVAAIVESDPASFNSILRRILHLWYLLLRRSSDYMGLTRAEDFILKQGWDVALAPILSLLRLSLMSLQGVQDCVACIDYLLKRGSLQIDELRYLIASASNMGIQIYNNKDYESACYPFRVAYDAAWARVEVTMQQTLSQPVDNRVNDSMLDCCSKCMTLADSLKRSGKNQEGFETLSDGLFRWATVHSTLQPHPTNTPSSLVHGWVRTLHSEGSAVCKSGAQEYLCLYSFFETRCQALHHRTIGLLLEEELLVLNELEEQGLDRIQSVKEQIMQSLLDNVYMVDKFPVERCRILLEKGRLARLKGDYDFASFSQVITVLGKTLKEVLEKIVDATQIANVENQLAMAYCAQAFCAYELDPAEQDYLESILLALSVWEVSARAGRTWIDLDANGNARIFGQTACCGVSLLRLLLSVNDLMALKGYSLVQNRVQQLIVSLFPKRMDSVPKIFSSLWANARFSHILCPVPYPSGFFSLLTQKVGVDGNSLQFWEDCALLCPGTLLDAQLRFMHQNTNVSTAGGCCQAFEAIEQIVVSLLRTSPKSSGGVCKVAALFHILAEHALDEGNLRVACKYAKEALNLRLRLVSRVFSTKYKGGAANVSENDNVEIEGQRKNNAGRLYILDSVATRAWPKLSTHTKSLDLEPNPWRVLGDYVESLMQVGVISEKMGAVDDALASFSEGYSVSSTQNLPLARAAFKSCLGEVQRKRHHWETAERELTLAKGAYENLESAWVCSCCCLTGRAVVLLRLGDLARRCKQEEGPLLVKGIRHHDAMSSYMAARQSLTAVLSTVDEACACSNCKYPGLVEGDNDKMHASTKSSTVCSKSAIEPENHNLISNDSKQELIEADLITTFSNLNLTQTESKLCDSNVPVRRNSRRKPNDDANPLQQKKLMEKRLTRSAKPNSQENDSMQSDASAEVASGVKPVNGGKVTRKRAVVKKSKVESQEIILSDVPIVGSKQDDILPAELNKHESSAKLISGRKELMSCVVKQALLTSMDNWTAYKWIKYCHQQLARVNVQVGKCHLEVGDLDKVVEMFEHASVLLGIQVDLLTPCADYSSYSFMDQSKSFFPIEEAALFYHKSLLQLKKIQPNAVEGIHTEHVLPMNWLVHAYSLSTQVPPLLRKISRLLSILHVPITCGGPGLLHNLDFSYMRERAAFFHQISIGAGSRQQHLAVLDSKLLNLLFETEESENFAFKKCFLEMQKALAVAPLELRTEGLSMRELVKGLPSNTICCVSLVEREQGALLKQKVLLGGLKSAEILVWVLSTRYSDTDGPLTVLLPANPLVDGEVLLSDRSGSSLTCPYNLDEPEYLKLPSASTDTRVLLNSQKNRFHTSLQDIASAFTSILEESRLSTSGDVDTVEERRQWWRWRLALDNRLLQLLNSMENTWLGPWKCLFVAEPASSSIQESLQICSEELGCWLRSSYGVRHQGDAHWNTYDALVRMLLQGLGSLNDDQVKQGILILQNWIEAFLDQVQDSKPLAKHLHKNKRIDTFGEEISAEAVDRFQKAYLNVLQSREYKNLQHGGNVCADVSGSRRTRKPRKETSARTNAGSEDGRSQSGLDVRDLVGTARKSITLVLDSELQGLPWESLPVLRGFETCRMPSVGGIRALLIHQQLASVTFPSNLLTNKSSGQAGLEIHKSALEKPLSAGSVAEPCVNPYNTYYVLNPGGDLVKTQQAFEDWFKENLGWEGKVGQVPSIEEYVSGLQKHDLYTYLGHGSGDQYLPERFVRRLDRCAAALLMGCSSGRFSPRGDYEPVGVPLSFLMAGCPAAIANLWDVTDGDIDRFSRFLLHKWLGTPNGVDAVTIEQKVEITTDSCIEGVGQHGSKRKCGPVKNVIKHDKLSGPTKSLDGVMRSKMGSFIGEGRNLCRLPYLIGASPVYYGVPTNVIRKEVQGSCS